MAWTNIALGTEYAVNEVLASAKMNAKVNDNLRYLHGDDGTIAFQAGAGFAGALSVTGNITSTLNIRGQGTSPGIWLDETSAKGAYFVLNSGLFQLQRRATSFGAFEANPVQWSLSAPSGSQVMDASGNIGLGTSSPAGKLHVLGAGAIAGAGHVIGSVAAVTSIQTVFAAGTVARAALFLILDRDNGGTAPTNVWVGGPLAITLSGSGNYIPQGLDTITIAVTAGGAVTAQRTSGTHGSHDITVFALLL